MDVNNKNNIGYIPALKDEVLPCIADKCERIAECFHNLKQVNKNPKAFKEILDAYMSDGLDINKKMYYGETMLLTFMSKMHYIKDGKDDCMQIMIDNGADINTQDEDGNTIIHNLLNEIKNEIKTPVFVFHIDSYYFDFLMKNEIRLDIKNEKGITTTDILYDIEKMLQIVPTDFEANKHTLKMMSAFIKKMKEYINEKKLQKQINSINTENTIFSV